MKKLRRIHILMILGAVFLMSAGTELRAQTDMYYNNALHFLQLGEVDSARKNVDLLISQPNAQSDPDNWYLYGVVYKEMYKRYETSNVESSYRVTAFNAFRKSLELDTVAARMK